MAVQAEDRRVRCSRNHLSPACDSAVTVRIMVGSQIGACHESCPVQSRAKVIVTGCKRAPVAQVGKWM